MSIDAVEEVRIGTGVCPDAVADVVHDAVWGEGYADVVGAFAANLPPQYVTRLDRLIGGDDLPVGVVGQVGADVGYPAVVDVGVGGFVVVFSVVIHLFL